MKIYINGRFLTQQITGVQRYAIELIKELDQIIVEDNIMKQYEIIVYTPSCAKNEIEFKNIKIKQIGVLSGHLWEQLELPFYTSDGFLINLCNVAPILKKHQIVTVHDAAVYACPGGYSFKFRTWYKFIYWALGHRLEKIITVSEFSKHELCKYMGINPDKIIAIHSGIEHILRIRPNETILKKYGLKYKKFVFAVSSMNPNKNFGTVVKAAQIGIDENYTFVIAGGMNTKVFADGKQKLPENVKHIGYVTDEELVALYKNAACFVYPSLYEGFGFPPLEAMAWGCPVVVSNKASLPEICGNMALYCDPRDAKDIYDKIQMQLVNPEINKEKIMERFNWRKAINQFINEISGDIK